MVKAVAPNAPIERMAWAVLILSFVALCGICSMTGLGVYSFIFVSTVPINAVLDVGRGTALVTDGDFNERGVRMGADMTGRVSLVSLDSQSQATLSFLMPQNDDEETIPQENFVASVTLKNSSEMRLQLAEMPRFAWTQSVYHIILRDVMGRMDVVIGNSIQRPFLMEIYTANGKLVYLNGAGRYVIDASAEHVKVITYEGEAVMFSSQRDINRIVPKGTEGILYGERNDPTLRETRINVVDNGLFVFDISTTDNLATALPGRWGCLTIQADMPRGQYTVGLWEGRSALRLVRTDNANNHGETRCLQPIDPAKQDISGYNYLELESSFLLNFQSLSDCGVQGSECPMMLRMTYTDINGNPQEWFQGFYYTTDPILQYPPRCASCSQDHLQINEKVWYTFESGNLFNSIPTAIRPAIINSVEFYASGHQYDVFVSEISVFVGVADVVPDVSSTN
jgi:hypothetical protein